MEKHLGRRFKEVPKEAQSQSHIFLLRGGYIRPVSSGIFSLLPLGRRVTQKIEKIIRTEMNQIDCQEVLFPVVLPKELWDESGRSNSIGPELMRMKDRNGKDVLLGMTHEEAACHMVRSEVNSYKQLPVAVYQIQTKYRDEARPRAGLIRVREFTMKDAYSFHTSQECLQKTYENYFHAYQRIFKKIGLKKVYATLSDTGMMGGSYAHEFMAISEIGEDTIFCSEDEQYVANKEVARSGLSFTPTGDIQELKKIQTPEAKTIEELCAFLKIQKSQTAKAVFFEKSDGGLVFALVRGDFDVHELKLQKILKTNLLKPAPKSLIESIGAVPGFASPLGLKSSYDLVVDPSVLGTRNLVIGANEKDHHFINFNIERDLPEDKKPIVADIVHVREGDPCPLSGKPLKILKGIEVGNIFQLGTKYSEAMNCEFLNENGQKEPMIMGCYGIGVGRAMASVIEQSHDAWGPIWPLSIAPFHVHVILLKASDELKNVAKNFIENLEKNGVEVLYDDRDEKPGVLFADADLIGCPFRIIFNQNTLISGEIETKMREEKVFSKSKLDEFALKIISEVNQII